MTTSILLQQRINNEVLNLEGYGRTPAIPNLEGFSVILANVFQLFPSERCIEGYGIRNSTKGLLQHHY